MSVPKTLLPLPKTLLPLLKTLLPLLKTLLADGLGGFYVSRCPQGQAVKKFSPEAVVNQRWYGYSTYVSSRRVLSCSTFRLSFQQGTLHLIHKFKVGNNNTKHVNTWNTGIRDQINANGSPKVFTFSSNTLVTEYYSEVLHAASDLLILRVCTNVVNKTGTVLRGGQYLEVMTKEPFPGTILQTKISNEEKRLNLDMDARHKTNQQNCSYDD